MAIDHAIAAGQLGNAGHGRRQDFHELGTHIREKLLDHMRPGDIHTHMYNDRQMELIDRFTGKCSPTCWRRAAAA